MLTLTALTIMTTMLGPSAGQSGPIIIRTCAPPASMCDDLGDLVLDLTGDEETAAIVGQGICPGSKCMACDAARDTTGDDPAVDALCDADLAGCSCTTKCKDTTTLSLPELFAVCFSHPMATGKDCEDPSVGQCLTTISWEGCAGLTTCEYIECHEDLEALGFCPGSDEDWPESCDNVRKCDDAEEVGGAVFKPPPLPLGTPTVGPRECLVLDEVMFRPIGSPFHFQWVEVHNRCPVAVDPSSVRIKYTNDAYGWAWGEVSLQKHPVLAPGACSTIGGLSSVANGSPKIDFAFPFDPAMNHMSDASASGVGLFISGASLPFDAVLYGVSNTVLPGPDGMIAKVSAGNVPAGHTIKRTQNWWGVGLPDPDHCTEKAGGAVHQPDLPIAACVPTDSIKDVEKFCAANPWGRPAQCGGTGPTTAACETMLETSDGCGVTVCEYQACAAALATAECGVSPAECQGISSCVFSSEPEVNYTTCGPTIIAAAPTAERPWVQIANNCGGTIDLEEHVLRWSSESNYAYGAEWLEGELEPGECMTLNGFSPAPWDNPECAVGLALFDPLNDIFSIPPSNSVTYGEQTCGLDWMGGETPDVKTPDRSDHIRLTSSGWETIQGTEPPQCGRVKVPPPVLSPAG